MGSIDLREYIKQAVQQAASQKQWQLPKSYSLDCAGEYDIIL